MDGMVNNIIKPLAFAGVAGLTIEAIYGIRTEGSGRGRLGWNTGD